MLENKKEVKLDYSVTQDDIDRAHELIKKNNWKDVIIEKDPAIVEQDTPAGCGKDIATLLKKDIESRAEIGFKKYGQRLLPNNGRNALWDAYQEAIDLCMYLRQKIEEEK